MTRPGVRPALAGGLVLLGLLTGCSGDVEVCGAASSGCAPPSPGTSTSPAPVPPTGSVPSPPVLPETASPSVPAPSSGLPIPVPSDPVN